MIKEQLTVMVKLPILGEISVLDIVLTKKLRVFGIFPGDF